MILKDKKTGLILKDKNSNKILSVSDAFVLPEHCILLDYMVEGHHYGIERNASFADYPNKTGLITDVSGPSGSNYFDLTKSKFKGGIPFATFDRYGSGGNRQQTERLRFTGLTKSKYPNGLTIEFLMRIRVDYNGTGYQCFSFDNFHNFAGLNSSGASVGSYWYSGSSSTFLQGLVSYKAEIGYNDRGESWHHYAYTIDFVNAKHYMFVDGRLGRSSDNRNGGGNIYLEPCPIYTTSGMEKANGSYDITQLAVWDYPKYKENFTVPKKLIIDL